jgi:hypothetical protein
MIEIDYIFILTVMNGNSRAFRLFSYFEKLKKNKVEIQVLLGRGVINVFPTARILSENEPFIIERKEKNL